MLRSRTSRSQRSPPLQEELPWGSEVDGFIQDALPAGPRGLPPSVARWRRAEATAAWRDQVSVVATVSADGKYCKWWADSVAKAASSGVAVPASLAAAADAVRDDAARGDEWPAWQAPWQSGPSRNRPLSPARGTGSSSSAAAAPPPPWRPAQAAQAAAAHPKRPACSSFSWSACLHSESGPFQRNDSLFSFFGSRGRVP